MLQNSLIATIERQSNQTVNGVIQSSWATLYSGIRGFLRPMSEQQAAVGNYQWGKAYHVFVDNSVDLKEGDRITVNSTVYIIRGVAIVNYGAEPFKKAAATLPES